MKTPAMHIFMFFVAFAVLLIVGSPAMAENPTEPGVPGDGVADLVIDPDGTAVLDTNGLAINGFILRSLGSNFTATATLPFAFFQTNNENEASVGFATPPVNGLVDLGQLYKPGSLPIHFSDLDFTYTVDQTAGLFDGNCIGCVPEPSTIVLLVMGVAGLWMIRRRRA